MKKILYVGNQLESKGQSVTTIDTLSTLLKSEGHAVVTTSNKQNKILRLLDMVLTFFQNYKTVDVVLIDTYSTTNFYYAYIISVLSKVFKVAYIPILHGGNLPERLKKSPKMSAQIFSNSYTNIAPSNYLKSAFEKEGYDVEFIPNVLEIKNYKFKERKQFKPNLLWVRSFAEIYNPQLAIQILSKLQEIHPNAKLCMIGADKGELQNCKALVKQLKLEKSVVFTGLLTPKQWHKKSEEYDVFINTTNFDNTPVSVMEAMALGLPVISTNVGGLPYLIDDKINGLLVAPNEVMSFISPIKEIINNPQKAIILAKNAHKKVIQFDWGVVKQQWNHILKNV